MIAKQTVYLNQDRTKAVAEGDKDARFLLVREGTEVNDSELEKYDGAAKLVGTKGKEQAPVVRREDPAVTEAPRAAKKKRLRERRNSACARSD